MLSVHRVHFFSPLSLSLSQVMPTVCAVAEVEVLTGLVSLSWWQKKQHTVMQQILAASTGNKAGAGIQDPRPQTNIDSQIKYTEQNTMDGMYG